MSFEKLDELLSKDLYSDGKSEKNTSLLEAMKEVSEFHYENCGPYKKLCDKRDINVSDIKDLSDFVYVPTTLFKHELLVSIPQDQIFRTISSSATSTGISSRVGLDKPTSRRQSKCFNKVVLDRLGNKRRKFIVMDLPETVERTKAVSARSSTIKSLLFCASETHTCIEDIDGKLTLDIEKLENLLTEAEKNNEEVIIFGFTYILYKFAVETLLKSNKSFNLKGSKVVHIGGWKKLESEKVSSDKLIEDCTKAFGVESQDVVDIYGFTEQSGTVYPTCEEGVRHMPVFADVIVRDQLTLEPLPANKKGLMQFITPIQTSYPGHSVLTEDIGEIIHEDNCPCGRKGKTFKIHGRAPKSEVRGCGDIMAEKFS